MTQNEKDLLSKDLCARLPYKVKVQDTYYKSLEPNPIWLLDLNAQCVRLFADEGYQSIEYIKPYLFPLSSMTEEQKKELYNLVEETAFQIIHSEDGNPQPHIAMDWYNKNHIDYRGLIEKGLANDATGLKVY